MKTSSLKVAWLVPSASTGSYFSPLLSSFDPFFSEIVFYTGKAWPNYEQDLTGKAKIKVIGDTKLIKLEKNQGYGHNLIMASPTVIPELINDRPDIIIAVGFSVWTLFALLIKPILQWKVIVIFDGISPSTSFEGSRVRISIRQFMSRYIDAFVANSKAASHYFSDILKIDRSRIYQKTYIIPDPTALTKFQADWPDFLEKSKFPGLKILYVGSLISRKGIKTLLEACKKLSQSGLNDYTLLLAGDGDERSDLEKFVYDVGLSDRVIFCGWVNYGDLGSYFQAADIFVLPSFEDTWGAVLLEAMAFGNAVVCSELAGSSEVIVDGKNGFVFNPYDPVELADKLANFFDNPALLSKMSKQSLETISAYNPKDVASFFAQLSESLVKAPF